MTDNRESQGLQQQPNDAQRQQAGQQNQQGDRQPPQQQDNPQQAQPGQQNQQADRRQAEGIDGTGQGDLDNGGGLQPTREDDVDAPR